MPEKIFVNRIAPQKIFWKQYNKLRNIASSQIISFYGAGGLGKTRLAEKLMDEFAKEKVEDVKYLYHDFINGIDMRFILRRWKKELQAYDCNFPLFETGDFLLFVKQGKKKIDEQQFQSWIKKSKWFSYVAEVSDNFTDNFIPGVNALSAALDITSDMLKIFPGVKTFAQLIGVIDEIMARRELNRSLDSHNEIRQELYRRFAEENLHELEKFLPILFAQDIADWMTITKNKLIIFLETYEILAGALSAGDALGKNNLPCDWWIRNDVEGEEGLIFTLPNTLWVISGRNKLRWKGELAAELKKNQHLLGNLSKEDSLYFLEQAGVNPHKLREEIFELTEGYPLYLEVCVDAYENYFSKNNQAPTIKYFGQDREKIIERLMKYMDDDSRLVIDMLSLLGTWTNEMAEKIIYSYDPNVYLNVKKFSFIHGRTIPLDDYKLEVFHFDRTLQKFIFDAIKDDENLNWLIDETLNAAEKYFESFIFSRDVDNETVCNNLKLWANSFVNDETVCYHLKLWADLIVNLTDDAELLRTRYDDKISIFVFKLIDVYSVTTAEEIINSFRDKVIKLAGEETTACAYFDDKLFYVFDARGEYEKAAEYADSSYGKFSDLLGKKNPDTIDALSKVLSSLSKLGYYEDALNIGKEILELCKEVFGENHPRTIEAIGNLANILSETGDNKRAIELSEKVLKYNRETFGEEDERTIDAMNNLAIKLKKDESRIDEALNLQEKVVEYYKENFGETDLNTLNAELNLATILVLLDRYKDAAKITGKILNLRKKICGEKHPYTLDAMVFLSACLWDMKKFNDSIALIEQVCNIKSELYADNVSDYLPEIHSLAVRLLSVGRHDESIAIYRKIVNSIFTPDKNGDIRDYIDSKFDETNKVDLYHGLNIFQYMIFLAEALLAGGKNDEALSWADHALKIGEKIFPELSKTNDEFYGDINFDKQLELLRKWHEIFLKRLRGEYVDPDNLNFGFRTAYYGIPFEEED